MKLIILKERLKAGINAVEKISQKTLTLPILQNTLLITEKNFISLSTTNLESGVTWWGLTKTEREGKICVPTKFFSNILSFLPNKPINLEVKDLILDLECENYKTKIKGFNSEEFPIIPSIKKEEMISVDNRSFCQSLNQLLHIPSASIARPEISGIFFSFQKDLIKMVATDSFRLAEKKVFLKNGASREYSLILPQAASREIVSIFGDREGELNIYFSPNQVWFEYMMTETSHPEIQFTSRLIEGDYPNYQEIIPRKFGTTLYLKKEDFLNQVKMASFFSGKINEIKIKTSPKNETIEISSQSPDLGEYKSLLKGKIKGKEFEISFNHRFLIDGVSEIKTKDLILELTDEEGPAMLKPTDFEDYLYIIMPIKTS